VINAISDTFRLPDAVPLGLAAGDHKAISLAYDPEHQETNKISLRNVKQ
jgi:hypothetical protein